MENNFENRQTMKWWSTPSGCLSCLTLLYVLLGLANTINASVAPGAMTRQPCVVTIWDYAMEYIGFSLSVSQEPCLFHNLTFVSRIHLTFPTDMSWYKKPEDMAFGWHELHTHDIAGTNFHGHTWNKQKLWKNVPKPEFWPFSTMFK